MTTDVPGNGESNLNAPDVSTRFLEDGGFCLLYTSDAADERSSVDLGGRRIIKKKKTQKPSGKANVDIKIGRYTMK